MSDKNKTRIGECLRTRIFYRHRGEIFPDEDWQEVLQVNLTTVWTLARDVGRHMLERRGMEESSALGRGKIINIASLLSFQGGLTVPAYAAAKHGVLGMVRSFFRECCVVRA